MYTEISGIFMLQGMKKNVLKFTFCFVLICVQIHILF